MAGLLIKRNEQGKLRIKAQGCCGNTELWKAEYERAFARQVLDDGGRIESRSEHELVLIDRKGRRHTFVV